MTPRWSTPSSSAWCGTDGKKTTGERYYFVTVYTDRTERDFVCSDLSAGAFRPVGEVRYHWFGAVPMIAMSIMTTDRVI